MLVEIKQKIGREDKTPEKEALVNEATIVEALKKVWPDEEFDVEVIKSSKASDKDEEYKLVWHNYKDELPTDGESIVSYSFKLYEEYGSGIIADQFNKKIWDEKDEDSKCDLWISEEELRKLYYKIKIEVLNKNTKCNTEEYFLIYSILTDTCIGVTLDKEYFRKNYSSEKYMLINITKEEYESIEGEEDRDRLFKKYKTSTVKRGY